MARKLGIKEGDNVRVEIGEDGANLRIVTIAWHLKEQEYFWSEEWQGRIQKNLEGPTALSHQMEVLRPTNANASTGCRDDVAGL